MSYADWELLAAILGGMGIAAASILVVYVFYCILIPYAGRGIFWIRDWVELRHWRASRMADIKRLHLDQPPAYTYYELDDDEDKREWQPWDAIGRTTYHDPGPDD